MRADTDLPYVIKMLSLKAVYDPDRALSSAQNMQAVTGGKFNAK